MNICCVCARWVHGCTIPRVCGNAREVRRWMLCVCVCVCVYTRTVQESMLRTKNKTCLSLTWCWGSGLFVAWHVQDRGTTVLFGQDVAHLSGAKRKGGTMTLKRVHRFRPENEGKILAYMCARDAETTTPILVPTRSLTQKIPRHATPHHTTPHNISQHATTQHSTATAQHTTT